VSKYPGFRLDGTSKDIFSLKNAAPAKQEQARLEVENAEDDLVQKTEVAITLMKTVLDNVSLIMHTRGSIKLCTARTFEEHQRTY
jgi:hypothetical protein